MWRWRPAPPPPPPLRASDFARQYVAYQSLGSGSGEGKGDGLSALGAADGAHFSRGLPPPGRWRGDARPYAEPDAPLVDTGFRRVPRAEPGALSPPEPSDADSDGQTPPPPSPAVPPTRASQPVAAQTDEAATLDDERAYRAQALESTSGSSPLAACCCAPYVLFATPTRPRPRPRRAPTDEEARSLASAGATAAALRGEHAAMAAGLAAGRAGA
jgi:hypothetical protein